MKILHLPLKKEWYEMIESGVKTEEYREIKPYWIKRLCDNWVSGDMFIDCINNCCENCIQTKLYNFYKYDAVKFSYGYTKRTMMFEIESVLIGKGKPEWGAPTDKDVFIIKLGKRYENNKI